MLLPLCYSIERYWNVDFLPSYAPLHFLYLTNAFQILSRDYLIAFGEHLSSLIPLLLSMAEGEGVIRGAESGGPKNKLGRKAAPSSAQRTRGVGALSRFRAVQCLTILAALPYPRLHPFKTLVRPRGFPFRSCQIFFHIKEYRCTIGSMRGP